MTREQAAKLEERLKELIRGVAPVSFGEKLFVKGYNDGLASVALLQSYLEIGDTADFDEADRKMFILGYSTGAKVAEAYFAGAVDA